MSAWIEALCIWIALAVGNFFYQALSGRYEWDVAAERSYFQLVALLVYAGLSSFVQ